MDNLFNTKITKNITKYIKGKKINCKCVKWMDNLFNTKITKNITKYIKGKKNC